MAQVSSDESRSLRKGDAGDQKVGSADPFQVLDLSEPVELGGGLGVEGNDDQSLELSLGLIQPRLGLVELGAIIGLEQVGETPLQDFDAANNRGGDVIGARQDTLADLRLPQKPECQEVSVPGGSWSVLGHGSPTLTVDFLEHRLSVGIVLPGAGQGEQRLLGGWSRWGPQPVIESGLGESPLGAD